MRFTAMRHLIPAKQKETFQTEVYGVLANEQPSYFPKKLVDAFIHRSRHNQPLKKGECPTIWVGIDPAGHQRSEMGIVAIMIEPTNGMCVVLGVAQCSVAQCSVAQVQALVRVFLKRLRNHPSVAKRAPLVPIVETNNNEVVAMSIVHCFSQYRPYGSRLPKTDFKHILWMGLG